MEIPGGSWEVPSFSASMFIWSIRNRLLSSVSVSAGASGLYRCRAHWGCFRSERRCAFGMRKRWTSMVRWRPVRHGFATVSRLDANPKDSEKKLKTYVLLQFRKIYWNFIFKNKTHAFWNVTMYILNECYIQCARLIAGVQQVWDQRLTEKGGTQILSAMHQKINTCSVQPHHIIVKHYIIHVYIYMANI